MYNAIVFCSVQLKGLTDNLKSRDDVVAELQKQHEEQLSRLTQLAKDREGAWNKQKEEMEQHYAQLLSDLQSRTKVGQAVFGFGFGFGFNFKAKLV